LEELLLEDNPLKAKKRNPKNDVNTMTAEMRLMEEGFRKYINAGGANEYFDDWLY
jgi:serine/threonine kinase 32